MIERLSRLTDLALVGEGALFGVLAVAMLLLAGLIWLCIAALRGWRRCIVQLETVSALQRALLVDQIRLPELCRLVHEHCLRLVPAPTLVLQIRDHQNKPTTCLIVEDGALTDLRPLPDHVYRHLDRVRRPVLIRDWRRPAPFQPLPVGAEPPRSGLYVPVMATVEAPGMSVAPSARPLKTDTLFGLLALQSPRRRAFSRADERALVLLASQVAMGLHTAQLYQQERQRAIQLLTIAEVSRKVTAILNLQTLFADTVQLVKEALGYYHVCILTLDNSGQRIVLQASSSPTIQERGIELPLGSGLIGHAAETGESVLANDVLNAEHYIAHTALDKTRSELAIPLKIEDRILGALDLQSDRVDAFDVDDVPVLQVLADQIAVAIEDNRIYATQQEQAWVSTALLQVAETVARSATAGEVAIAITRLATLLTGVDRCLLLLWSAEANRFSAASSAGLTVDDIEILSKLTIAEDEVPFLAIIQASSAPYHGGSADLWRFLPSTIGIGEIDDDAPSGHLLAVPLWAAGQFIGVLVAEDLSDNPIKGARETILTGMTGYAAMALENARLNAAQREEAWVSTALLQVANVVAQATSSLEDTLATIARLTPMLVGIEWSAILLWNEERQAFYCTAAQGRTPDHAQLLEGRYLDPESSPLLADMMRHREPMVGHCELESAALRETVAPDEPYTPITALPLQIHDRLVGALLAGHDQGCEGIPARRMSILSGIANQAAMAIDTAWLYEQSLRQERLRRELELARSIQHSFLPPRRPAVPGWQIEVQWHAAGDVGGDFYDLLPLSGDRLGLVIADVSDKGVGAALYMALSRTVMRTVAREGYGPAETLRRVNNILMEDAASGMFVSLFYGILDVSSGQLTYARAGHNPPLYVRDIGGEPRPLNNAGTVLGVLPDPEIQEATIQLQPGDVLVMYTDGVTEAIDGGQEEFGEERLAAVVAQARHASAQGLAEAVSDAVQRFVGESTPFDDLTLLVLKREKSGDANDGAGVAPELL
jgi:phosphoserine phosphatase RsbU/P